MYYLIQRCPVQVLGVLLDLFTGGMNSAGLPTGGTGISIFMFLPWHPKLEAFKGDCSVCFKVVATEEQPLLRLKKRRGLLLERGLKSEHCLLKLRKIRGFLSVFLTSYVF